MTRTTDMSGVAVRPFLIAKDQAGDIRPTVRETRYNSQNYSVVTSFLQEDSFKFEASARANASKHFGAEPGQFASK